ncbi:MAG: hypothetical protein JRC99_09110 [Deltaproteobacteria bacterium]|nr:hypothetical protein [Deltaproteobacteria bacterium]
MDLTVYNPQKGRLETISVELTADNTTRFDDCEKADDIAMITDWDGDLLITGHGRDYPIRIYGASRSLVNYDQLQAKALQRQTLKQQG